MIELQKLTPEIYYKQSRDFQLLGRLYDIVLNAAKTNADILKNLPTISSDSLLDMSDLLTATLGFQTKRNYSIKQLGNVCSVLPQLMRYKGSLKSIQLLGETILNAEGITDAFVAVVNNEKNQIEVFLPEALSDSTLFTDLLDYILPAGFTCIVVRANLAKLSPVTGVAVNTELANIVKNSDLLRLSRMAYIKQPYEYQARIYFEESEEKNRKDLYLKYAKEDPYGLANGTLANAASTMLMYTQNEGLLANSFIANRPLLDIDENDYSDARKKTYSIFYNIPAGAFIKPVLIPDNNETGRQNEFLNTCSAFYANKLVDNNDEQHTFGGFEVVLGNLPSGSILTLPSTELYNKYLTQDPPFKIEKGGAWQYTWGLSLVNKNNYQKLEIPSTVPTTLYYGTWIEKNGKATTVPKYHWYEEIQRTLNPSDSLYEGKDAVKIVGYTATLNVVKSTDADAVEPDEIITFKIDNYSDIKGSFAQHKFNDNDKLSDWLNRNTRVEVNKSVQLTDKTSWTNKTGAEVLLKPGVIIVRYTTRRPIDALVLPNLNVPTQNITLTLTLQEASNKDNISDEKESSDNKD